MAAKLDKQFAAMDSLAWRITYEWNKAKNEFLTIKQMQEIWQDITKHDANYNCLTEKEKKLYVFYGDIQDILSLLKIRYLVAGIMENFMLIGVAYRKKLSIMILYCERFHPAIFG